MPATAKPSKQIKKYKNRRLYDMDTSQYITVDDLQRYVLEGTVFVVTEAANGKDITNATLLQIFVEMESTALPFLSAQMLRQLIVIAQHPMSQSFKSMLEQAMQLIQQQMQQNQYLPGYQQVTELWQQHVQQFFAHWQHKP